MSSSSAQDTIVAIATPPGEGAIGIVRLSGPTSIPLAASHIKASVSPESFESYRLYHVALMLEGVERDDILCFLGRAPHTYTGEDTVEFQCHGSPALLNRLVRSLQRAGARAANPGEFTQRAFLNGKIDLTQAEAVADLVSATTDTGLDSAYFQLRGGLRSRFESLSDELRQTKTLLEAQLDFSEDVTIDPEKVSAQLRKAVHLLDQQIHSYRTGKLIREGARVTLCGRPNVGKSSLLNALLGEDRAIVTNVPGTTRDTIEESIEVCGIPILLTDTAGLRETDDPIEQEGNRRSNLAVSSSDLLLIVCDGSAAMHREEHAFRESHPNALLVANKKDLGLEAAWQTDDAILVSAKEGTGLDALRMRIGEALIGPRDLDREGITNERHVVYLKQARDALTRATDAVLEGAPGEIVSLEIDEGLVSLAGIIGETTAQDILDAIFSQFCIGK